MFMSPAAVDLAIGIVSKFSALGESLIRLIAGADADVERARLAKSGILIDEVDSDKALADAKSHYPDDANNGGE